MWMSAQSMTKFCIKALWAIHGSLGLVQKETEVQNYVYQSLAIFTFSCLQSDEWVISLLIYFKDYWRCFVIEHHASSRVTMRIYAEKTLLSEKWDIKSETFRQEGNKRDIEEVKFLLNSTLRE